VSGSAEGLVYSSLMNLIAFSLQGSKGGDVIKVGEKGRGREKGEGRKKFMKWKKENYPA